jgi:hypothetical protein
MKKNAIRIFGTLCILAFAFACGVGDVEAPPEEVQTNQQAVITPGGNLSGGSGGSGIYQLTPNSSVSPYCTSAVAEGAVSPLGVVARLGGLCQCMTGPTAQPVYTFKAAAVPGWLKCKP